MEQPALRAAPLRLLVAESETEDAREQRRATSGRSSGETVLDLLALLAPDAVCERVQPVDGGAGATPRLPLEAYDAVILSGSPLHVYEDTPAVRRQVAFMRAVFGSGTPSFGSCAGLQVAVAAAGGTVRPNDAGHEVAFARGILRTAEGRVHPLLDGRPDVFDAPAIHADEVATLPPEGATLLATNRITAVQAAEIIHQGGVFWGVQYHPELPLSEIADALRRQADQIIGHGLAADHAAVERHAGLIDALHSEPGRRDLAWQLGIDEQVTRDEARRTEVANFLTHLVGPTRSRRGRA